jgi:hypothetical protein
MLHEPLCGCLELELLEINVLCENSESCASEPMKPVQDDFADEALEKDTLARQ